VQRPTPTIAPQLDDAQRRRVDTPERVEGRAEDMENRRPNHGGMGHGERAALDLIGAEPGRDALDEVSNRLAAMGGGLRIGQPQRHGVGVGRGQAIQRTAGPTPEGAVAQRGLDARGKA
jgi:hypothetical protein